MEGKVIDPDEGLEEEEEEVEEDFEDDEEEDEEEESFEEEERKPRKVRKKKVVKTEPSVGDILNYTKEFETCVIDEEGNKILCNEENRNLVQAKTISLLLEQRNLLLKITKVLLKRFGKKNG